MPQLSYASSTLVDSHAQAELSGWRYVRGPLTSWQAADHSGRWPSLPLLRHLSSTTIDHDSGRYVSLLSHFSHRMTSALHTRSTAHASAKIHARPPSVLVVLPTLLSPLPASQPQSITRHRAPNIPDRERERCISPVRHEPVPPPRHAQACRQPHLSSRQVEMPRARAGGRRHTQLERASYPRPLPHDIRGSPHTTSRDRKFQEARPGMDAAGTLHGRGGVGCHAEVTPSASSAAP